MLPVTLQEQRGNGAAHRVGENKTFTPVAGNHFLLPKRSQIVNIVAKAHNMTAVGIRQQPTGAPLTAVIDNHYVKAAVEEIVG